MSQVIVVGASAGGVEAATQVIRRIPADVAAPILVVLHISSNAASALPDILQRAGELPAHHPVDYEPLRNGLVYVAPPDHHLLLGPEGTVRVVRGPRENGHRPAIDPLFRSAARYYGERAIGIVLSGALDDGAAGLRVLTDAGGTAIVQDPEDALYASMPEHALAFGEVRHVVPAGDMGPLVGKLVAELAGQQGEEQPMAEDRDRVDMELALTALEPVHEGDRLAPASHFSCPDCHGVLNEIAEGDEVRFRCRVGHAWSPESLLAALTDGLENALWMALRTLEEKASLARRLATRARDAETSHSQRRFEQQAADAQQGADAIRALIARASIVVPPR